MESSRMKDCYPRKYFDRQHPSLLFQLAFQSDYTGSWSKSDAKCCPATSDTCTTDKLKINDKSSNHRNLLTPPFASEEDLDDSEQFSSSIGGGREETPCSNCTTGQSSSYSIDIAAQPPTSATMQNNSDLIYCNDKNKSSDVASIKEEDRANSAVSSATIGDDRHINGVEEEDIKIKEENHVPESTTLGSALSVEEMGDEKEQASSPISLRPDDEEQPPQSESNEQLISSSVDQNDKKLVISIDNHSLSGGNMNESSLPGSNEITEVAVEPDEPSQAAASESAAELPPEEQAKAKRKYVLMEFLETERDYVKDLGSVVEGYMATIDSMELPEDMKGKERFVFANIQQIHEFHKNTFLKEIEPCVEDYDAVGRAFVKYERRLHMYVVYCQNKPKSEFLVSEYETFFNDIKQKLGHRLNIADLLIKPVQRIMKYQLLMKDILKYTERAGQDVETLKKALQVMHVVPKACDDMMHVGRLQGFEGKITAQGKLLHQGTLVVSDNPSNQVFKGKDRRLFLFEQSLIIADCILPKKEFSNPQYIYKSHIMINKMGMETEVPGEPLRLILKNKDPTGPQDVVVQCSSAEDKQQWVTQVKQLLDTQMDFLKALQHPIAYQKQLNKDEDEVVKPKNVKSPIMSRLAQLKGGSKEKQPQRTESCPGPANAAANSAPRPASVSAVASPTADSRKHSLPDPKNSDSSKANKGAAGSTTTSPKSKSKLFDGFRNPLKSRSTKL